MRRTYPRHVTGASEVPTSASKAEAHGASISRAFGYTCGGPAGDLDDTHHQRSYIQSQRGQCNGPRTRVKLPATRNPMPCTRVGEECSRAKTAGLSPSESLAIADVVPGSRDPRWGP